MNDAAWVDVLAAADLPAEDVLGLDMPGHDIALYSVAGEVFATANHCTHGDARLCDGFLEGHEIECPLHQGKFDVRSGQATGDPAVQPLRCFPVKVEGGRVYLKLGSP